MIKPCNEGRSACLSPIVFLILTLLYLELVLHISRSLPLWYSALPVTILCNIALASFLAFICCLPRNRTAVRTLCIVMMEVLCLLYVVCFFMDETYGVFMSPAMVAREASNAVSDFGGNVLNAMSHSLPVILLYHIPVLLALILHRLIAAHGSTRRTELILSVLLLVLGSVGAYGMNNCNEKMRKESRQYVAFDSALRRYGLVCALEREITQTLHPKDLSYSFAASNDTAESLTAETNSQESCTPSPTMAPIAPEGPAAEASEQVPSEEETTDDAESFLVEEELLPDENKPLSVSENLGQNIMDLDFSAAEAQRNTALLSEYIKSRIPTNKNEYTGIFAGKNLILITAEAFSKEVIDPALTPTLYRMANKGIVFEDFYQPAWGGSTSTGEYSWLTGLAPSYATAMMASSSKNLYFTMGNQLQRLGYFSCAYHNGSYYYYDRNLTHPNLGYSQFIGVGNGLEEGLTRGEFPHSDREMIDFTLPQFIHEQPFSIYYMTISGHASYGFSSDTNDMAIKNREVTEHLPYSAQVQAYLACNMELEYAMESLLKQLEEADIADDTVIALVPDHYPYGLSPASAWGTGADGLSELYGYSADTPWRRDHNAAIIWCGELEKRDEPIRIQGPTSSLDLLPTLSNLFGLEFDSRLLAGHDVLADTEPLVFWNDGSWLTEKGCFNAQGSVFTPAEGSEVDQAYLDRIHADVANKINLSLTILQYDYYGLLFGKDLIT